MTNSGHFVFSEENKQNFIVSKKNSKSSASAAKSYMWRLDEYELYINKEIFYWDRADFRNFYDTFNFETKASFDNLKAVLRSYVFLCNRPESTKIVEIISNTSIPPDKCNSFVITKKEYYNFLADNSLSLFTKTIIILLWHSITEDTRDIFDVLVSNIDFDNKIIVDYNGNQVKITNNEVDIIKDFIDQQETYERIIKTKHGNTACALVEITDSPHKFTGVFVQANKQKKIFHDIVAVACIRDGRIMKQCSKGIELKYSFYSGPARNALVSLSKEVGARVTPMGIKRYGELSRTIDKEFAGKERSALIDSFQDPKIVIGSELIYKGQNEHEKIVKFVEKTIDEME